MPVQKQGGGIREHSREAEKPVKARERTTKDENNNNNNDEGNNDNNNAINAIAIQTLKVVKSQIAP